MITPYHTYNTHPRNHLYFWNSMSLCVCLATEIETNNGSKQTPGVREELEAQLRIGLGQGERGEVKSEGTLGARHQTAQSRPTIFICVLPVMGDHGEFYSGC